MEQGQTLLLDVLKMVMEESTLTSDNMEMCSVTKKDGAGHFHIYATEELDVIIKENSN